MVSLNAPRIVGDIETYSECDLKRRGMACYAEHPSTDLNCFCWKLDDGAVHAWVPQATVEWVGRFLAFCIEQGHPWQGAVFIGPDVPGSLRAHLAAGGQFNAFNAGFERLVLNGSAGANYDFPHLEIAQMVCSMANARVHGLPGGLEDAANAVEAPVRKRLSGAAAMRYLSKPRKDGSRPMLAEEPERFMELVLYCRFDVESEDSVDQLVPPMTAAERKVWEVLDQKPNDVGCLIDLEVCDDMQMLIGVHKRELEKLCLTLTGIKPSRAGPLAGWIRAHGFPQLENLQADTVRKALMLDLPEETKTILRLYSTYNAKSVTKFDAFSRSVCGDARIRHMFMFYGAGTGRWSAHHIQNLARGAIPDPDVAIAAAKEWDLDWLRTLYPGVDPSKVIASCVRGAMIARPGHDLVFPDFSGIEARYNAWLGGEAWKLAAYRAYDRGEGPDLYVVSVSRAFGLPVADVTKDQRQLGKVMELALGYEGGVGAFIKMAGTYRIDLKDIEKAYDTLPQDVIEEAIDAYGHAKEQGRLYDLPEKLWLTCEALKRLWRRAHPGIVALWRDLKDMAIKATLNPGVVYRIPNGKVMFKVEGQWLVMRLPSGRKLWYYRPEVKRVKRVSGQNGTGVGGYQRTDETFYYMGINTQTRQYGRASMYGGSWCNNETQGGCRDILVRSMFKLDAAGYPLIGSVHDQPLMEVPHGFGSDEEIERLMCSGQTWDTGLPLAIELHRGPRFKK